jgi:uncharacterized delta-60 repeat protein
LKVVFIFRKDALMISPGTFSTHRTLLRSCRAAGRATTAATALAVFLVAGSAGCDDDTQPGQGGSGGRAAGTGGAAPGTGGAAPGTGGATAGSGGMLAATGGAGGAAPGTGGSAGAGGAAPTAVDTEVVVARFNADGTADTTFGTNGVFRHDIAPNNGNTREMLWGMAKGPTDDALALFVATKGAGTRTDTDRAIMRLTANGALDTTFAPAGAGGAGGSAGTGIYFLNVGNLGETARHGIVQADGKILSAGYSSWPTGVGAQTANRVQLVRLNADGTPDATFGAGGIVVSAPFMSTSPTTPWGMAEAYGVALQAGTGSYITTGYGRLAPSGQVNVVCFRYTAAGLLDTTFGMNGIFEYDHVGADDRGRNIAALPGDRLLVVGSLVPAGTNVDAMAMILTPNGARDTTFGTMGVKSWELGAGRNDEAFYGLAVAPSGTLAGASGYSRNGTDTTMNDDSAVLLLPLGTAGTEVAKAVPLSATEHDRLWGVAFDSMDRMYATGFITQAAGNNNKMVLVRLTAAGAIDTTFAAATAGIASLDAAPNGGTLEEARAVVVQSTGKIVIAGVAERP